MGLRERWHAVKNESKTVRGSINAIRSSILEAFISSMEVIVVLFLFFGHRVVKAGMFMRYIFRKLRENRAKIWNMIKWILIFAVIPLIPFGVRMVMYFLTNIDTARVYLELLTFALVLSLSTFAVVRFKISSSIKAVKEDNPHETENETEKFVEQIKELKPLKILSWMLLLLGVACIASFLLMYVHPPQEDTVPLNWAYSVTLAVAVTLLACLIERKAWHGSWVTVL